MAQSWQDARLEELHEQENKIFKRRDEAEKSLNTILGIELTSLQLAQVRQAVALFESCEEGIERVQNCMAQVSERVGA